MKNHNSSGFPLEHEFGNVVIFVFVMCHSTAVFHLFAPVRLPRPRVLTTVVPPSFFVSRSRLRLTAYQHCWGRLMMH